MHLAADGATRKAQLDGFGPQPGDIVLFRSDYSHVAMVSEYDAATGNLMIIEGNRGDKVQATVYGSGDDQITYISRFNDSDYGEPVNAAVAQAADPSVSHRNVSGAVSTQ